jgi:hypothetical protein
MNRIQRCLAALAGRARALFAIAAAAPAALITLPPAGPTPARHPPLPSWHIVGPGHEAAVRVPVHTVVTGGMPAWQIALIAAGAALASAVIAVILDRAWAAHRRAIHAAT